LQLNVEIQKWSKLDWYWANISQFCFITLEYYIFKQREALYHLFILGWVAVATGWGHHLACWSHQKLEIPI
jgi:hypothetical protein